MIQDPNFSNQRDEDMKLSHTRHETRDTRDTKQASKKQQEPIDEGTKNSTSLTEQVPDQGAWRTSHKPQTIQDPLLDDDTRYLLALPIDIKERFGALMPNPKCPRPRPSINQSK